jgi:monofunctional glycosyltransferase
MDYLKVDGWGLNEYPNVIPGVAADTIRFHDKSVNCMTKRSYIKNLFKKASLTAAKILFILFVLSLLQILLLKWIDPFSSSIMFQRQMDSFFSGKESIRYEWYNYEDISGEVALAVIASEDQNFPKHFGFDFEQISKALKERKEKGRLRGASTITQQVAKNLFLWEDKSFIRKGFEAYYTVLLELLWSKKRIIEVYLNIAQTGKNIFGVGAASKIYFVKHPADLTADESALIAAVLPNPVKYSVHNPSDYIRKRQAWILNQMKSLGGTAYIKDL